MHVKGRKKPWRRAVVHGIRDGPHGPWAITTVDDTEEDDIEGSVTFSLLPPVWKERTFPGRGTHVLLQDIQFKNAGWRAARAKYVRPNRVSSK